MCRIFCTSCLLRSPGDRLEPDLVVGAVRVGRVDPQAGDGASVAGCGGEIDGICVEPAIRPDDQLDPAFGAEALAGDAPVDLGAIPAGAERGADEELRHVL